MRMRRWTLDGKKGRVRLSCLTVHVKGRVLELMYFCFLVGLSHRECQFEKCGCWFIGVAVGGC